MRGWFYSAARVGLFMITLLLLGAGIGYLNMRPARGVAIPTDTASAPSYSIVALGDSFMSGEGAAIFYTGTDLPRKSSCRRSPTAYPVLVSHALTTQHPQQNVTLTFVACSGALTKNVGDRFTGETAQLQYPDSGEGLQIQALRTHPNPDLVLISIGGNDAKFFDVVKLCTGRRVSCVPLAEKWLENLGNYLQPQLRSVFTQVRELAGPNALIYALTYPDILDAAECPDIGMDRSEVAFLKETFLPRLRDHIRLAADAAHIRSIDLTDVFRGEGLCAHGRRQHGLAVNAFRWQHTGRLFNSPTEWLKGSMHPTEFGHALIALRIVETIESDLRKVSEPPTPGNTPWWLMPGADRFPQVPATLPPFAANEFGAPLGPWTLSANACSTLAQVRENRPNHTGPVIITEARPGSPICYQTFKSPWSLVLADSSGSRTIPFKGEAVAGVGGWRNVLYQNRAGDWVWATIQPAIDAPTAELDWFETWLGARVGLVVSGVLLAFLIAVTCHMYLWRRFGPRTR